MRIDAEHRAELVAICGADHVRDDEATLRRYSSDQVAEERYAAAPEVVVLPANAREVAAVVKLANRHRIPVTPRGGGSGLSGGAVPVRGGIVLALGRMNRIVEIDDMNMVAVVEPGVVTRDLDRALEPHGLFFAGYPMSEELCQIGGNVAENAGGGRAVKYGVTGTYVIGMEVVLPTGELVELGGKRLKDVTGYDLLSLIVGSEGTLGVITRITLRLLPRPAVRAALVAFLSDEQVAVTAGIEVLRDPGLQPSAVEFVDSVCVDLMRDEPPLLTIPASPCALMLVELDGGDAAVVERRLERLEAALAPHSRSIESEIDPAGVARLWDVRKKVPWILKRRSPHQTMEDVSVPVSTIAELVAATRELAYRYKIRIANFGHLGDGNIHTTPLKPPEMDVPTWHDLLAELLPELYRRVVALGGTISGEHGIGHKRREYVPIALGSDAIAASRRVRHALDPNGIMNPGKMWPEG